jgi:hypothetical protein
MRTSSAILWASAFALGAAILLVAGRLPANPAYAGMATTGVGGFTLVAAPSGSGPSDRPYEVLYVIDNQAEYLYIYSIESANDRRIVLRSGAFLPNLFRAGRGG